jgi:hypothetical protein
MPGSRSFRQVLALLVSLIAVMLPAGAYAQATIDFENVPGGTPADQLAISTQYLADHGVSFSLEGGGTPYLEASGAADAGHGFYNWDFGSYDIESTGYTGGLGGYFLRFGTTTFSPTPGPVLAIDYATPVSGASGQIWDIDAATGGSSGYEAWTVEARDALGSVIDTIVSPNGIDESLPASMNGEPWVWSFSHPSADIHSITIRFTGTASLVGLAFDNFSPSTPAAPPAVPSLTAPGLAAASLLLAAVAAYTLRRSRPIHNI